MDDIDTDGSDSVSWEEFISGVRAAEAAARIDVAVTEEKAGGGGGDEEAGGARPALRWARIPWPAAKRRSDEMFRRAQQLQRRALDLSAQMGGVTDLKEESGFGAEHERRRSAALKEAHGLSQKAYHLRAVYQGLSLQHSNAEGRMYRRLGRRPLAMPGGAGDLWGPKHQTGMGRRHDVLSFCTYPEAVDSDEEVSSGLASGEDTDSGGECKDAELSTVTDADLKRFRCTTTEYAKFLQTKKERKPIEPKLFQTTLGGFHV